MKNSSPEGEKHIDYEADLDDNEIQAIFETSIKPNFYEGVHEPKLHRKRAVFVGGQPGSGKSSHERLIRQRLEHEEPGTVVEINGDDFRGFNPRYMYFLKQGDVLASDKTNIDNAKFIELMIDESMRVGCHSIVEGTFRRPGVVVDTASKYHDAGYATEAMLVAVHPVLSRLGVVQRYVEQRKFSPVARFVIRSKQDAAINGIPDSTAHLISGKHVDYFAIIERGEETLFSINLTNSTHDERQAAAQEARSLIVERYGRLSESDYQFAKRQIEAIDGSLQTIQLPDPIADELADLKSIIEY